MSGNDWHVYVGTALTGWGLVRWRKIRLRALVRRLRLMYLHR